MGAAENGSRDKSHGSKARKVTMGRAQHAVDFIPTRFLFLVTWFICGSESDLSRNAYDGFKVSATTLPSWLENRKTSSALVAKSYLNVLDFFFLRKNENQSSLLPEGMFPCC